MFDRFYRFDRCRDAPGDGRGLSLVAAAARLRDQVVAFEDIDPRLRVLAAFTRTARA